MKGTLYSDYGSIPEAEFPVHSIEPGAGQLHYRVLQNENQPFALSLSKGDASCFDRLGTNGNVKWAFGIAGNDTFSRIGGIDGDIVILWYVARQGWGVL